jgi:hypothetical protein
MPPGFVDAKTEASTSIYSRAERENLVFTFPADGLVAGENQFAVELHQRGPDSSDFAFDMTLEVIFAPPLARGPVELPTPSAVRAERVNVADPRAVAAAGRPEWRATAEFLLDSALKAHAGGDLQGAARRYYAYRWADVFAGRAIDFDPALKGYLLGDALAPVSQEFFDLLSHFDDHGAVFQIIDQLYGQEGAKLQEQPRLAMAIALVYDQEPPATWPHHQVPAAVLPRKLPDPLEAFRFWYETGAAGRSLHPLGSLTLEELKFVVDTPAPLAELLRAQDERMRLDRVAEHYSGITYIHARARDGIYDWPHPSYTLDSIKRLGGICVDQAYFATQVAKAHGVPAMVVAGTGQHGNHAWVGYLGRNGRWDFDVGRYPESKFVTGVTYDPQTWRQPTDHELAFLGERFRNSPAYRLSRVHSLFAEEYLERLEFAQAARACEAAIASEARNLGAWETLIQAKEASGATAEDLEAVFTEGAKAFGRYADLEASFLRRLAASLDERGDPEGAAKLRRQIIVRNQRERPDLAIGEARAELDDALGEGAPAENLALYKSQINRFKEAGLIAFYSLTEPFLNHHADAGETAVAREALDYTRRRMEPEPGSQLEEGLATWDAKLGGG